MRSLTILTLILSMSSACALTIEETMRFETEQRLRITVLVRDFQTPNASLTWPISSAQILEPDRLWNQSGRLTNITESGLTVFVAAREPASLSFLVRFPCQTERNHAFPTAQSSANISGHSLRVLLPDGWTATECSQGCSRTYDAEAGRVALEWPDVRLESCQAVLVRPGVGEAEIRWRLGWMMIRGYLLIGLLAVIVILAAILVHRIAFQPTDRRRISQ